MENPLKGLINWRRKRVLILVLLIFICFGDSMVARTYLAYLCHTEAGTYTYHQIELDESYWNEMGDPLFLSPNESLTNDNLKKRYQLLFGSGTPVGLNISRGITKYKDMRTNETLAEIISFSYSGGWFVNNAQPFHSSPISCSRNRQNYRETDARKMVDKLGVSLMKKVFIGGVKSLNYHQSDHSILFSSSFEDVVKRAFIREVN